MNYVYGEKMWNFVLDQNFSSFLTKVKKNLENDLEIYLYIKFRLYLFLYSNLSLFSVFSHFCFCKRSCDHISSKEFYSEFFLEFIREFWIGRFAFKILLLRKGTLLLTLIVF